MDDSDEDEELTVAKPRLARHRQQSSETSVGGSHTEDEDLSLPINAARNSRGARQEESKHRRIVKKLRTSRIIDRELFPVALPVSTRTGVRRKRQEPSHEGATTLEEDLVIVRISKSKRQVAKSGDDESIPSSRPTLRAGDDGSCNQVYTADESEKPAFEGVPPNPKQDIVLGLEGDTTHLPGCTAQWLRPYQIDGIMFLYDLYTTKTGGILGDDMGLGKTVQVIGFLNAVFGKTGQYSDWKRMREMRAAGESYPVVMIICPGTLIDNWLHEFETWSWTHVAKFHGAGKEDALHSISSGRSEVLITTYTTYKTNKDSLNQISWSVVIADECHIIKEKKSEITRSANEINSDCRIGLTGTAIQNNYDELFTLLEWTNPGAFGTAASWNREVSSVLKNGQKHTATNAELSLARRKAIELSKVILPRVLLRRTKALIAHQLPKKVDKVVFCPLTTLQITAYDNLMDTPDVAHLRDSKNSCPCGSGNMSMMCCHVESPSGKSFAEMLFPILHYLRNLSNHMALCLPKAGDHAYKRERDQTLLESALPDEWRTISGRTPMQNGCDPEMCGKWKVLQKLLRHWKRAGSKVLIFSSSVKLLDMLNDLMMQENYLYEYLHGGMTLESRSAAVDNFNNSKEQFVFLISTRAGGVGLNIVSANKVVIFDPNWNPAHDLQAQDRAYRIGQRRDVEVYRLISTGTVEEVVYARQVYKQQQANIGYDASEERRYFKGVQGDAYQRGELFGVENLLTFHGENHVLKAIFDDTSAAENNFDNIRMANMDINATQENIESADAKDVLGIGSIVQSEVGMTTSDAGKHTETIRAKASGTNEDAISLILANAGVSYSHKNNEIIGRSEIEVAISREAAKAAVDVEHQNRQAYLATLLKSRVRTRGGGGDTDRPSSGKSGDKTPSEGTKRDREDGSNGRRSLAPIVEKKKRVLPWS